MCRLGATVIKCATTGGASSRDGHGPFDREFTREEMEALVGESHDLGRRVMCHALGGPGLRLALEVGVDSIEHGTYLNEDPDLIPMMAEKGNLLCAHPVGVRLPSGETCKTTSRRGRESFTPTTWTVSGRRWTRA